ncbi:M48 family metalloprotease [Limnothrix sp. FACHB-1083]|uniref:M48 family metalloprotease n=1 Tax=unclassified Limnothrix TaxID=2632864 RepID=UPI00168036F5|nr:MULTISPECIES: M48 family metalloprotease [unclassified Limnothrix]MBD2159908.1 M48 family metalloprotease [Limnothrix sp. FACHB-1083]MBD2190608.1 M48 family metalloprotease [Limnothrix sp. FACHB-1088]
MAELGAEGARSQLQAGLAALKQGQPAAAIAPLETASATLTGAEQARAQAALVGAYRAVGQWVKAIALCESLLNHPNPQVRQWATQARSQLKPPPPPPPTPKPKAAEDPGFVPLEAGNAGFVPLTDPQAIGKRTQVVRVALNPHPGSPALGSPASGSSALASSSGSASADPGTNPAIAPATAPTSPSKSDRPPSAVAGSPPLSPNPDRPPAVMAVVTTVETTAPEAQPPAATDAQTPEPYSVQWRNGGRADRRTALTPRPWGQRLVSQAIAIVLLAWIVQQSVLLGTATYNKLLDWLSVLLPWLPIWGEATPYITDDPSVSAWIALGLLFLGSPWLLDEVMHRWGSQTRKFSELSAQRPETARLLQRLVRSRNRPVPYLRLLTTDLPVVVVYGWLPAQARLAISQGAIDGLSDGELATLVAAQYSQIDRGDSAIASWATVVLLLPYGLHQWAAQLAETWQLWPAKLGAVGLSALAYGLYRVERWALFGWSRSRQAEADRLGAAETGDPNALARALVKCGVAVAEQAIANRALSPWLVAIELLLPFSPTCAAIEGSFHPIAPPEPLWAWGRRNPYRTWLQLNHTHPLTGQRMATLAELAVRWRLEPEFEASDRAAQDQQQRYLPPLPRARPLRPTTPQTLWLQSGPWVGMVAGVGVALLLWVIGGLGRLLNHPIGWMWADRSLLWGLAWMGCGLGIFLRLNAFFPEIRGRLPLIFNHADGPPLASALAEPNALPIDAVMVKVSGRLLGRSGWANGLWQDLWLQTPSGLLPLHLASRWGWLGTLIRQSRQELPIGSPVMVTGWLRRGGIPWIDVESLNLVQGRLTSTTSLVSPDAHPLRSVLLGAIAVAIGFSILMRYRWF